MKYFNDRRKTRRKKCATSQRFYLWVLFERVRLDLHGAPPLMYHEASPADPGTGVITWVVLYGTTIRSIINSYDCCDKHTTAFIHIHVQ